MINEAVISEGKDKLPNLPIYKKRTKEKNWHSDIIKHRSLDIIKNKKQSNIYLVSKSLSIALKPLAAVKSVLLTRLQSITTGILGPA